VDYSDVLSQAEKLGATGESRASSFGAGGESPAHKRLKELVAQHPEKVGLPAAVGPGKTEAPLKSGDTLDVCFRHGHDDVAVEVKREIPGGARSAASRRRTTAERTRIPGARSQASRESEGHAQ
jgi:hypothetical protein